MVSFIKVHVKTTNICLTCPLITMDLAQRQCIELYERWHTVIINSWKGPDLYFSTCHTWYSAPNIDEVPAPAWKGQVVLPPFSSVIICLCLLVLFLNLLFFMASLQRSWSSEDLGQHACMHACSSGATMCAKRYFIKFQTAHHTPLAVHLQWFHLYHGILLQFWSSSGLEASCSCNSVFFSSSSCFQLFLLLFPIEL